MFFASEYVFEFLNSYLKLVAKPSCLIEDKNSDLFESGCQYCWCKCLSTLNFSLVDIAYTCATTWKGILVDLLAIITSTSRTSKHDHHHMLEFNILLIEFNYVTVKNHSGEAKHVTFLA